MNGEKIERTAIVEALRRIPAPVVTLDALLARLARSGPRGGGKRQARGARKAVLAQLRRLIREGEVERVIGGYRLARADGLIEGEVAQVDARGEAVVIDGRDHPWTVATYDDVEPGARVLVAPTDAEASRGSLVERVDLHRDHWVGIVRTDRRGASLVPFRSKLRFRIPIGAGDLAGARDGEVVIVEPRESPRRRRGREKTPRGRVVERLGRPGEPEADFHAIVWNHRLPNAFPEAVQAEAERFEENIGASERELRVDLREQPFLTIDPATARDHDDALYVEPPGAAGAGAPLRLWVAIADVSHYVAAGSALDREALRRGNSVYFCDRAIPMLPERISNDLCSLRAGVDRLAVTVALDVARDGQVANPLFQLAVIRVRDNLAYEAVAPVIEGEPSEGAPFAPEVREQLERLGEIERRLGKRRFEEGSIEFDLPESEIVLDEEGLPGAIERRPRTRAHRAVEEAMLAANRAVARWLLAKDRGAIFRAHEAPADDRLEQLREELERFGLLEGGRRGPLDSKQIHQALGRIGDRAIGQRLNMLALRTMTQARYCEENRGHFALGFDAYLHFTSPIRRYADLLVHRVLKHALAADRHPIDAVAASPEARAQVARFISHRERVAIQAERDSVDLKKCVFMQSHVGETFEGDITGVAAHGLYVTLREHDVTGLVPIAGLGHRLELDEQAQALTARGSGARYALGDALEVEVEDVNLERGWIRFRLCGEAHAGARSSAGEAGAGRGPRKKPGKGKPQGKGKAKGKGKGAGARKGRRAGRSARRKSSPTRGRGRR